MIGLCFWVCVISLAVWLACMLIDEGVCWNMYRWLVVLFRWGMYWIAVVLVLMIFICLLVRFVSLLFDVLLVYA